jgi:hypothetical protein
MVATIIIYCVPSDLKHSTDAVEKTTFVIDFTLNYNGIRIAMHGVSIKINTFVCQEVAIFCDRKLLIAKEFNQLVDCGVGGIVLEVVPEFFKRR